MCMGVIYAFGVVTEPSAMHKSFHIKECRTLQWQRARKVHARVVRFRDTRQFIVCFLGHDAACVISHALDVGSFYLKKKR